MLFPHGSTYGSLLFNIYLHLMFSPFLGLVGANTSVYKYVGSCTGGSCTMDLHHPPEHACIHSCMYRLIVSHMLGYSGCVIDECLCLHDCVDNG